MGRVSVVVLGDVARSPRMQYHSISLATHGQMVDLIGYFDFQAPDLVTKYSNIKVHYVKKPPNAGSAFGLILKCIWQTITLFWCLQFTVEKPDIILLQNPPGFPTIFICWLVSRIRGATFLIDWHNYTWSIFRLRFRKDNILVRFVRWFEFAFGRWSDGGFCVSDRMKDDLHKKYGISVNTFYDRPSKNLFRPVNLNERHAIMYKMAEIDPKVFVPESLSRTIFTELSSRKVSFRKDRPALLLSSTSWTPDENFQILFDALTSYDNLCQQEEYANRLPKVICVVTGRGPLRDAYLKKLPEWTNVKISTPWMKPEDYPKLLACADLGVCLHESSSGLDLPMKAVDMLGCRVPVLAFRYPCIDELVDDGVTGFLFDDDKSLLQLLVNLLDGFPGSSAELFSLRRKLDEKLPPTGWDWDACWNSVVRPVMVPE